MKNLERVLNGPEIPEAEINAIVLKATSELLLHPDVTSKAITAWGTMLRYVLKK